MPLDSSNPAIDSILGSLDIVIEHLTDGIVFADSNGNLLHFNQSALKMHGFKSMTEIFKHLNDYPETFVLTQLNGENLDLNNWPLSRVLRGERFADFEVEVHRTDKGHSRSISYSGTPIFKDGKLNLAVLTLRDVTEAKSVQAELEYQGQLTKTITDNAASALFMMDKSGHPTFMNPAAMKITGHQNIDEIRNKPLHYAVHWKKPDGSYYPMEECPIDNAQAELKAVQNQEEIFCRKDGSLFPVSYSVMPLEKDGEVIGSVLEFRDISEEKKVAAELKEREAEFRSLANSIPQLAWMADSSGWIYWYNQRWYDYTGTTFEEMQGWGWEKVHHPEHKDRIVNFVKEAWNKPEPFELTFPLKRKDGEWRWFLTRAVPSWGLIIAW